MRPHLSINVKNVGDSVEFYKKVFGQQPQKQTADYAKFDLKELPLNFTMQTAKDNLSSVNHLGIEVESSDEVMKWQKRLTEAGLVKLVESDTNCCFARQDKVWFQDPDGNAWEVFYVIEQMPVEGELNKAAKNSSCCAPKIGQSKSGCC